DRIAGCPPAGRRERLVGALAVGFAGTCAGGLRAVEGRSDVEAAGGNGARPVAGRWRGGGAAEQIRPRRADRGRVRRRGGGGGYRAMSVTKRSGPASRSTEDNVAVDEVENLER